MGRFGHLRLPICIQNRCPVPGFDRKDAFCHLLFVQQI
jgi:hypothetical protein